MKTNNRFKVKDRLRAIPVNSAEESHIESTHANVYHFVLMDLFTIELLLGWPTVKLLSKNSTPSFLRLSAHILKQSIKHFKEDQFTLYLLTRNL